MKITAYALALVVLSASVFTAYPLTADAKGGRDLYGTGSADDIDITKLLDMALNRGGMSMSPSTIRAFLEYWWDSIAADLNTIIGNVDAGVTTTKDFTDYVISALENADHYDKLGEIMKKYVQFAVTLEFKNLSDLKQLLTQEGTFRKFLLSYVTDEDGNIVNTVDNKLKRYRLKGGFVNMVREAADAYIDEYESYYLVSTYTYNDLPPSIFNNKDFYDSLVASMKTLDDESVLLCFYYLTFNVGLLRDVNFVGSYYPDRGNAYCKYGKVSYFSSTVYNSLWQGLNIKYFQLNRDSGFDTINFKSDNLPSTSFSSSYAYICGIKYLGSFNDNSPKNYVTPFTSDGRAIKVWKTLDAMKSYTVGKCNIYYTNNYSRFDNSVDNSVTFTGQYYTSNAYSHTAIQQYIDNSQDINETVVNNIVNNYIINNYYGTDTPGGDVPGGDPDTGNWFTELLNGIPQLLAALADGLAALSELGGKLAEGVTNLFTKLFVPSEGFADPIKDKINNKFYFINETHSDIIGLVDRLDTMGKTVPTVTFPLSKTPLSRYGVGDLTVSFEWFEPYRTGFQLLISAIMWAMFLFNQFFSLKNLIQGTDSLSGHVMVTPYAGHDS